jgi:hypothetical protein
VPGSGVHQLITIDRLSLERRGGELIGERGR